MYRFRTKFNDKIILSIMGLFLCALADAQNVSARAEVDPSVVMVGERAEYTIRFIGTTQIPNLATPRVDGLAFAEGMNSSSFRQIINGAVTVETRASWSFSPARTGNFTIPGRTTRIGGKTVKIQPVSLRAVPMDEATRSRALLQLELPEGPYYVGQALPAKLGLFIRDDLTLSNIAFPERDGEAFLNTEFDNNPSRTRTRINGRIYEAFIWEFILTPIKSGPASLVFTQNIAIQESRSDGRFPSIFNLSRTQTEPLSLFTDGLELEVLPLPNENRPDSFTDAIGTFEVSSALSSRDLMVGEPITLTLTVKGTGNFDRIAPPELQGWENWRVYPPKVEFQPDDELGFSGTKRFEYILIPQSETIETVPPLTYAYFNPEKPQYEIVTLEEEAVTVSPADKPLQSEVFKGSANNEDPQEEETRIPDALLPIRPEPGKLIPPGQSWGNPGFWSINGLLAVVLLIAALILRHRSRLRNDNRLAKRHFGSRKIRRYLQNADKSAREGNPTEFFSAARAAIQERISHLSKIAVESKSLVSSDCLDILRQADIPDVIIESCSKFLQAADAFQFAGSQPVKYELSQLNKDLKSLMSELNRFQK